MSATSFTLIDIAQKVSLEVDGLKKQIETVENPDTSVQLLVNITNSVIRDMLRYSAPVETFAETMIATLDDYDSTDDTGTDITDVVASTKTVTFQGTALATSTDDTYLTRGSAVIVTEGSTDMEDVVLRVASVTDATNAVLDNWPYGDVSSVDYDFKFCHDRYDLPTDFKDFVSASCQGPLVRDLEYLSPSEFDYMRHEMRTEPYAVGTPRHITIRQTSNNLWQLEIDPFPDDVYTIQITYTKSHATELSADTDAIPLADQDIDILISGIVAKWHTIKDYEKRGDAYRRWRETEVTTWLANSKKKTDEKTQFKPADVMRASPVKGSLKYSSEFDRR